MPNEDTYNLKNQVYEKILLTIKRKKRRKQINIFVGLSLFLIAGFFLTYLNIYTDNNISKGQHLFADISAGEVTVNGKESKTIKDFASGESAPFEISERAGVMILRARPQHRDDITQLNVGVGGFYKLILADGTTVSLNSNSQITYKGDFIDNRQIQLRGEAFFEVAPRVTGGKQSLFTVITEKQRVEVLGTMFNVKSRGKTDQTVLTEGLVRLKNLKYGNDIELKPGERADIQPNGKISVSQVGIDEYTAWKEGDLYFEDKPLSDILEELKNIYPIQFDETKIPQRRYTIFVKRDRPFSDIITLLEQSSDLRIHLKNENLIFTKNITEKPKI